MSAWEAHGLKILIGGDIGNANYPASAAECQSGTEGRERHADDGLLKKPSERGGY
jgi:hypothetical protein